MTVVIETTVEFPAVAPERKWLLNEEFPPSSRRTPGSSVVSWFTGIDHDEYNTCLASTKKFNELSRSLTSRQTQAAIPIITFDGSITASTADPTCKSIVSISVSAHRGHQRQPALQQDRQLRMMFALSDQHAPYRATHF
jgi:hypothetical protein